MPTIVIAAGGTAGHVVPALAIADELRASGADVHFVGTRDRLEAELVPAAGYEISHISATALDRNNPLRALRAGVRGLASVGAALRLLRTLNPDAVLAAGGYVAGPVGLAAALRRTPLVLTESDSRLGVSNRLLAPFARRVCLSFPLPGRRGRRYLVTGRPVSGAIVDADRGSARERLDVEPESPCLLVFGGSLGARSINNCAFEAFAPRSPVLAEGRSLLTVLHVTGRRDYAELAARRERLGGPGHYRLYEYLESLADPLAASDLVLARAGGSVFEIAAAGKPAVLIPYPHATAGHQTANAGWMAGAGAAVVIPDDELDAERLWNVVRDLIADRERLGAMARAARSLARPDAAERVAEQLLAAAKAQEPGADAAWNGRRLHFVGIGGAGMSGLALVARSIGADVSGCDRAESAYTQMLREAGIEPQIGHSEQHLTPGIELVVSTAVPDDNPELEAARRQGAPIIHRGALLAELSSLRRLIAVAGTHGKTTTAAMAAHALGACGLDPSYLIGAELRGGGASLEANASWGAGGWLVAEADESDRSFLRLSPEIAVVTNIELDHHTTYGSLLELEQAFQSFLARLPARGTAVVWDRPELRRLAPEGRALRSYGIDDPASSGADLVARGLVQDGPLTRFELARAGEAVCEVVLPVPGRHNVLNALAALCACELAGCDVEQAARSLTGFRAAGRRFEQRAQARGVLVFDDYAHHPSEVAATLEAARALEPGRLIAVFQPHLYSRTLHLHRELGCALARADVVVVLDVYPARERPEGELAGVSGKLVADACADAAGGRPVWWLPTLEEAESVIAGQLAEGDLVVTLGAGDIERLAERLAERLDGSRPKQTTAREE
jgi:UDP-N-acetylmuramate--alanine ligase